MQFMIWNGRKCAHAHIPLSLHGRVSGFLGIDLLQTQNSSCSDGSLCSGIFTAHSDMIKTLKFTRTTFIMGTDLMNPYSQEER